MKKIFILSSAFIMLAGASANAEVSVGISLGGPVAEPAPMYIAPAPTYITPVPDWPSYHYDRHRHWHNDYWAHRHYEERHAERR